MYRHGKGWPLPLPFQLPRAIKAAKCRHSFKLFGRRRRSLTYVLQLVLFYNVLFSLRFVYSTIQALASFNVVNDVLERAAVYTRDVSMSVPGTQCGEHTASI